MTSQLLPASQVGRRLGISAERVRQLARSGRLIPAEPSQLGQLWSVETVEAFAATRDQWGRYPSATGPIRGGAKAPDKNDADRQAGR